MTDQGKEPDMVAQLTKELDNTKQKLAGVTRLLAEALNIMTPDQLIRFRNRADELEGKGRT